MVVIRETVNHQDIPARSTSLQLFLLEAVKVRVKLSPMAYGDAGRTPHIPIFGNRLCVFIAAITNCAGHKFQSLYEMGEGVTVQLHAPSSEPPVPTSTTTGLDTSEKRQILCFRTDCPASSLPTMRVEYFTCRLLFLDPLLKPVLLYLFAYLILPSKLLLAVQNVPTPRPPLSSTPDHRATCLEFVATWGYVQLVASKHSCVTLKRQQNTRHK